jgi:tetratricopeptide (TPR) repeat protein
MKPAGFGLVALLGVLCLPSLPCTAQTRSPSVTMHTSIRGNIRDAATHQALARVVVMIDCASSGYAGQAETDSSGKFEFQGLNAAQYSIRISAPGYNELSQTVDLTTNPMAYLSFELRLKPGTATPAVAPEGPQAALDARLASVPEKARKEFLKARDLWQQGKDPQDCVDHLNKAVKFYPQFADAYVLLGSAYMQQNNVVEAGSVLNRAIEIDPKLADARFTLGTLQNRQKDYASAEKNLNEGLKLDNASPQGHYELAKTYWAQGRWQDAEPQAQKAIALLPTMAPAHVLLGNIALRKGDIETARTEFKEYLRLDPQGPMSGSVKQMIEKIDTASNQREAQKK